MRANSKHPIDHMLSTTDRLRLGELEERLAHLTRDDPFLSIVSVDTSPLRDALCDWARQNSPLTTTHYQIDRDHPFKDYLVQADDKKAERLALLDCLDLSQDDEQTAISGLLFFRDELPLRKIKAILITSPRMFNGIVTRAYDLYSFSTFSHVLTDHAAITEAHLAPQNEETEAVRNLAEREAELAAYRQQPDATPEVLIRKLFQTAVSAQEISDNDRAMERYKELLKLSQNTEGPLQTRAAALGNIGLVYKAQGDLGAALKHLREALEIHRQIGYQQGVANQLGNIGLIYHAQGDLAAALKHLNEALEIDRRIGYQEGVASDLGNIGLIYQDQGDLDAALKHLREALEIHRRIGHQRGVANQLGNIGLIYQDQGDLDAALKHLREALEIDRQIGYQQGVASDLGNIGLIYQDHGDLEAALKHHGEALEIHRQIGYQQGMANQLGNIGLIYQAQGDLDAALKHLREALEIHRQIGYQQGVANQLGNIGLIYQAQGDLDAALKHLREALEIDRQIGHQQGVANQLGNIGLIYQAQGDLDAARKYAQEGLTIAREIQAATLITRLEQLLESVQ